MIHKGTYDGTIYHNPANRFCIISVKTADKEVPLEARSTRRYRDHLIRFVATGYELPRTDAVELELDGEWKQGKYGMQLQVEQWREIVPRTKSGVEGYLASGLIKGIGPATAALIVSRFGEDTLDILQKQPERLLEIKGITESKLEEIKTSYAESRMLQDLLVLLSPFKITPKTALKIYQYFGPASVDILKKSPFELCQISGFGFLRVDAIVQKNGGDLHDPMRVKGALFWALEDGKGSKGHLFLPGETLQKEALRLLNNKIPVPALRLQAQEVTDVLQDMILKGEVVSVKDIVITYNDVAFSKSCGRTGHHYKDGLAFKFEDDLFETKLQMIEWTPGRTGEIAPVAVFAPVEIDGCEVSRASLHNLSFIEDLELTPGNRILVSKRNLIIPHVEDNLDRGGFVLESAYPHRCPCCGEPTRIHETRGRNENGEERTIKTLFCDNAGCETRKLKQFVHFVGKKAMNIEGLSEATLEKLIGRGWIHSYLDIYRLDQHKDELVRMDGFGERSWQRLWSAIQQSRNTTFERYVIAMDIPMIGNTASGVLCRVFHGNLDEFRDAVYAGYDFRQLPDFGDTLHNNIHEWFSKEENFCVWEELQMMMKIQKPVQPVAENNTQDNPFAGKTIVVTGKVEPYTRDEMNSLIASLGAIAGSSVTRKTHYLVCGEKAGSKLSKARELGVPVLEPQEFFRMAGVA